MSYGASNRVLEHECKGDEASLVKNLFTGGYKAAARAAVKLKTLRSHIAEGFAHELKNEMKEYKRKGDNLFSYDGNPQKLSEYSTTALVNEAKEKLPLLYTVITESSRKSKVTYLKQKEALILSSFLNTWIPRSNFVYRNNVLLCVGGCKGEVTSMFQKQGLCSHKNTTRNVLEKVSKSFDKKLQCWKDDISSTKKQLSLLKECLSSLEAPEEDQMDISTFVFTKETLQEYKSFEDESFQQCQNLLPLDGHGMCDVDDIAKATKSLEEAIPTRYRYVYRHRNLKLSTQFTNQWKCIKY